MGEDESVAVPEGINIDWQSILKLLEGLFSTVGGNVLPMAERMLTVPQAEIRAWCAGMAEADIEKAVTQIQGGGKLLADGLVIVATRGTIQSA